MARSKMQWISRDQNLVAVFSKFSSFFTLHQYLTSNSYIWPWLLVEVCGNLALHVSHFYRSLKQIVSEWTLFMSHAFMANKTCR
jgi:hypothetical protein